MSKVICSVCGTSYPDTETQCPICGCVRPGDAPVSETTEEAGGYTYVKGGRFSKTNVRKRAKTATSAAKEETASKQQNEMENTPKDANKKVIGLVIVLVLLLLIAAVMVYFIITFNNKPDDEGQVTTTAPESVVCTDLDIRNTMINLSQLDEWYDIDADAYPNGCTEKITYTVDFGEKVIKVDDNGRITSLGNGDAMITVTCGKQTKQVDVKVRIPLPTINFNYSTDKPLEFASKNERKAFYESGSITAEKLRFLSDNENVATVDEYGTIHAVGKGETLVHTYFGDEQLPNGTCKVICDFEDPNAKPGEEDNVDLDEYYFGSYYGKVDSVGTDTYSAAMKIGDKIQFGLIHKSDRSKNIYFEWERPNPDDEDQSVIASEDKKTIERVSEPPFAGSYCLFKATYEGQEYYLRIGYYQ